MPSNSISAPARFTFDAIIFKLSTTVLFILSLIVHSSNINSYTVFSTSFLSTPNPLVILPCGSKSIANTFFLLSAKQAARLIAVVVFPTPPFWFAIAIILPILVFFSLITYFNPIVLVTLYHSSYCISI